VILYPQLISITVLNLVYLLIRFIVLSQHVFRSKNNVKTTFFVLYCNTTISKLLVIIIQKETKQQPLAGVWLQLRFSSEQYFFKNE